MGWPGCGDGRRGRERRREGEVGGAARCALQRPQSAEAQAARGFINQGRAQRFLKAPGPGGVSAEGPPRPNPSQIHPSGKDRADPLTRGTDAPPGLGVGGGARTDDGTAFQGMQVPFTPLPTWPRVMASKGSAHSRHKRGFAPIRWKKRDGREGCAEGWGS